MDFKFSHIKKINILFPLLFFLKKIYLKGRVFFIINDFDNKSISIPDKLIPVSEGLLEDIRHELVTITGLNATDYNCPGKGYISLNVSELIELDFTDLINKLDEVLNE